MAARRRQYLESCEHFRASGLQESLSFQRGKQSTTRIPRRQAKLCGICSCALGPCKAHSKISCITYTPRLIRCVCPKIRQLAAHRRTPPQCVQNPREGVTKGPCSNVWAKSVPHGPQFISPCIPLKELTSSWPRVRIIYDPGTRAASGGGGRGPAD